MLDELEALVPVSFLSMGRIGRLAGFIRVCRSFRPDGVIFHFFGVDQVLFVVACVLLGIRNYHCKAGNPAPEQGSWQAAKWRTVLAFNRAIGCPIVSASAWIESSLLRLGRLPRRSRVVHNGCAVAEIHERAQIAKDSRASSTFVVGMIARLDPIKDHETLLRSFSVVRMKYPGLSLRLLIVGDGPLDGALRSLACSLMLAPYVSFVGSRKDVPEQLGAMDVCVLSTTRDEGFGIVLIEALAAGVPIIASNVPACAEVLRNGELGRLVEPANVARLADAISKYLLLHGNGSEVPGREQVEQLYGLRRLADQHLQVLFGD